MELRLARLLYDKGVPAVRVAAHLLGPAREMERSPEHGAWVVAVLREAADRALTANRVEEAVARLEQAYRLCPDRAEQGAILFDLARGQWLHSPTAARRCLDRAAEPVLRDPLAAPHSPLLVRYLLRGGRNREAGEILHRLHREADALPAETRAELRLTEMWLAVTFPPAAEHCPYDRELIDGRDGAVTGNDELRWQAVRLLAGVLGGGADGTLISEAEQALRLHQVSDATLEPLMTALSALTYADRLDLAAPWCRSLMAAADGVAPDLNVFLSAPRAEIALRTGDLTGAARFAHRALDGIDADSWGAEIGSPLATLVLAELAAGRTREADKWLQLPAAGQSHDSRFGLQYRHARGHYHLAVDQLHAAVRDFLDCGALMRRWDLDVPGFLPWRAGAAEALLRAGERARAAQLVKEQWALLSGDRSSRSAGTTLRLCAAVAEPERRPALLRKSAEILQACHDRYELARTMADLAAAHEALGESAQARDVSRQALRAAEACSASPLAARLRPAAQPSGERTVRAPEFASPSGAVGLAGLSSAEAKVAALASMGLSNREIGNRLHITVSTVEQHLTRVYRKLNVNRREDLPAAVLQPFVASG